MAKLALVYEMVIFIDQYDEENPATIDHDAIVNHVKQSIEEAKMNGATIEWVAKPSKLTDVNVELIYDEVINEDE